ncbi:MAG: TonB-dependent receptor [Candidatus Aminicenantes bacterium]|nr:TonB-dependent receptor [Candidatus Aminicenantes bacterium]
MRKFGTYHSFLFAFIVAMLFMGSGILAQTTLVTVEGTVADEGGIALPGASVTVINSDTGYTNSTLSRADGYFIISGIQPGKYEIEVRLDGFSTQIRKGMTFAVGARLTIDFQLVAATLEEEVTIIAESPMIEVTKSEVSKVIDREKIEDLPLYDRDFGSLAILKAGVQGDRSNAQPGGSEEIIVDGVSNEWVGRNYQRSSIPADAVEEFRVMTNQYQAEYGNASGMIWNAITRSGTNELKGRLSFFYRDEGFDDVNYFVNHETYQGPELSKDEYEKPPYSHYLFGGFLGGPIKKDKAHFFIAYDGLRHTEYTTITSPLVSNEQLDVGNNYNQLLAKFNYQLSEKHLLTFRYTLDRVKNTNQGVGGLYTKERANDYTNTVHEFQGNWTFYPSNSTMNEFRVLYSYSSGLASVHYPDTYSIDRPSGYFGKAPYNPQQADERRLQFVDNFNLFVGNHTIKFGVDFSYITLDGFADQYIPGNFIFTTDAPFDPNNFGTYPLMFVYNAGVRDFDYPYSEAGIFVQDSWKVHPRLTLNYGLRWNYYYCKDIDINHSDLRHLNPRFGFSWDPIGDNKTSIRGGIGTYSQNPQLNIGLIAGLMAAMDIRTMIYPNYPDPFQPNPFFPTIPGNLPIDLYTTEPDLAPAYTVQMTLGGQREVVDGVSLGADLVWTKGYKFTRLENFNPIIPGTGNQHVDPTEGNQYKFTDNGKSDYKGLYLTLTKRYANGWALDVSYTLSQSKADVESEQTSAWSYDEDAWERQYGPTNNDARHRLAVSGVFDIPFGFQLSGLVYFQSKLPWTAYYPTDVNRDSLRSDYVDEYRNSRRGFDQYYINLRISKYITIDRFRLQIFAEGYNITNRTNFGSIYNYYGLAAFGDPLAAGSPRQLQFGARFDF